MSLPPAELRLGVERRQVVILLALILIPMTWFLIADLGFFSGGPVRLETRLLMRAAGIVAVLAGLVFVQRAASAAELSTAVLVLAVIIISVLIGLNLLREPGSVMQLRTPLMALVALYIAMPNTLRRQLLPPLLYSAVLIYHRLFVLNGAPDAAGDIVVLVFVNLVGVVAVTRRRGIERAVDAAWWRERDARQRAEAALGELRTLRGIIRVCSYCRKVHNEDGAWQQIEAYVRARSHAEFSHGICPDCAETHFPDGSGEPAERHA